MPCAAVTVTGTCTAGASATALVTSTALHRARLMPGAAGGPARETSKITLRILKTSLPGSAGTCSSYGSQALRPGKLRAHEPGPWDVTRRLWRAEAPASRAVAAVLPTAGTGPRCIRQRSVIIALLNESADFRTAQDLHRLLCARGEKAGLATVYRTLHALVRAGEVDTARTARGEMLYRRCSPGHHHHLICGRCGRGRDHQPGPETVDRANCRRQRLPRHRPRP